MQLPIHHHKPASAPCTTEFMAENEVGEEYQIQVSWPLAWEGAPSNTASVPVFYLLDGNAHFFTAVEAIRRGLAVATSRDAVVVGIGYPDCGHYVFGNRRSYDLTPQSETYTPPKSWDGKVFNAPHGGADVLLRFIRGTVRQHLFQSILPDFQPEREILAGHSYGALCALHALFSGNTVFDTFIAVSPTIWWNDKFIQSEETNFLRKERTSRDPALKLYISYGGYEQYIRRRKTFSEDAYAKRAAHALELRMKDASDQMASRLCTSGKFDLVKCKEYPDEDHGSVAACALNWAICDILDPDRFV